VALKHILTTEQLKTRKLPSGKGLKDDGYRYPSEAG